ncbi:MAG TPA: 30S ribosome-binding factor RbfA [Opitutaceae bacterium]
MSHRTVRINELVQRELSDILRRHYQSEAVAMTITEVRVAPDLRDGRVFVSIVGTDDQIEDRLRWIKRQAPAMREELGRRIVLKYLPKFEYLLDRSAVRSVKLNLLLDQLDQADRDRESPKDA